MVIIVVMMEILVLVSSLSGDGFRNYIFITQLDDGEGLRIFFIILRIKETINNPFIFSFK